MSFHLFLPALHYVVIFGFHKQMILSISRLNSVKGILGKMGKNKGINYFEVAQQYSKLGLRHD